MKKSVYFLVLFLLIFFGRSYSQVNLQNGSAAINLPLCSYQDAGNRLALNASLVYLDGNGMKVSEMASAVGTGWMLDCGGAITRIQQGEPDDQKMMKPHNFDTQFGQYAGNYCPDGNLNTTSTPSDNITNGAAFQPYRQNLPIGTTIYKQQPQWLADREQDVFAFSFNGQSGQFVIGRNRQVKTLTDSKLKISLVETDMSASNIRTEISQFTITDESGIQYVFKDLELSYVTLYNDLRQIFTESEVADLSTKTSQDLFLLAYSNIGLNVVLGKTNGWFVVNKWYLSQIINPLTGKQITFNYSTYEEDFNADKMVDISGTSSQAGNVNCFWDRYKVRGKRLSSVILSPAERIDLTYSPNPRKDLPAENTLDQLKVSYDNAAVYSWKFGYGYFIGNENAIKNPGDTYTSAELQWSRLCLLSLQRTGTNGAAEPPYQFAYNLGGDNSVLSNDYIPPMFSIYQDHFGYYNAANFETGAPEGFYNSFYNGTTLRNLAMNFFATNKKPLSTVAKNGIIKSINYPMGGSLAFFYEMNVTPSTQLGGVRVNQTVQYDGISHTNDVIKQYKYVNVDEATSSGWGGENYVYTNSSTATAVGCQNQETPAVMLKELASNYIQDGFLYGSFGFASAAALGSAIGDAIGGVVIGIIVGAIIEAITGPPTQTATYTEHKTISMTANNPLPWGYARTEVVSILGAGNVGKIAYEFSNPNSVGDRPIDIPTPNVQYSDRPRYASWVYGLPKTITVYDNNVHVVKQTVNHYNYIVNTVADNNFLSKSWSATSRTYSCGLSSSDPGTSEISQESWYPFTGHSELTSTDEIVYNSAQQSTTVTTNYEYDNNFQLKHQYYNNSKGEKVETFYYHPYDFSTASGAIATMNNANNNIFNAVLSTETYINKSDGHAYMTGASVSDYDIYSNGDIKPKVIYAFQNPVPVLNSALQPLNTTDVLRDPAYFKQLSLYDYDNNGNLVQIIAGGNSVLSKIYDYDGKLVIASADNASYSDIGYTSFETPASKPGAWLNMAAVLTTDARTGSSCFNLSDPSNASNGYCGFSGLNGSLTYIVSFWAKSGTACVAGSRNGVSTVNTCQGGAGWKQGATINGWTYFEVQVSNADRLGLSGTGLVDEFRIYPVGAQMRTRHMRH